MANEQVVNDQLDLAIKALLERLFKVSADLVTDETRRGTLEQWDSLGHLELLDALRKEFKVKIEPEEAVDIETVADIKRVVQSSRR